MEIDADDAEPIHITGAGVRPQMSYDDVNDIDLLNVIYDLIHNHTL